MQILTQWSAPDQIWNHIATDDVIRHLSPADGAEKLQADPAQARKDASL